MLDEGQAHSRDMGSGCVSQCAVDTWTRVQGGNAGDEQAVDGVPE